MYAMSNGIAHKTYLVVAIFLVFCAVCFSGCINENTTTVPASDKYEWMDTEMTNVVTGETFTLGKLAQGKPVVVHIFATWCPACNAQLVESTAFLKDYSGKAHIVSVDIDSSETPAKIADHVTNKEYDGIYAVAEKPVVQGFMELFGEEIMMSIPQTIIINGNDLVYLGPGVIKSATLASQIDTIQQLKR
jgi:thiol-disulfide isomerase/thioredoxin